jgi:hypothetical protein
VQNLHDDRNQVNGNKLRTYRTYKTQLCTSAYVKSVLIRSHRQVLANFRSGSLPLAIETGRYAKPKVQLNERICIYCNNNCVEDEMHLLMEYEFYSDLRYFLFQKGQQINETFSLLNTVDKFIFLMNDTSVQPFLAKTMFNMFCRRKYCEHPT